MCGIVVMCALFGIVGCCSCVSVLLGCCCLLYGWHVWFVLVFVGVGSVGMLL